MKPTTEELIKEIIYLEKEGWFIADNTRSQLLGRLDVLEEIEEYGINLLGNFKEEIAKIKEVLK